MKNPFLKNPIWINIIILILLIPISAFTLLFGFAHVVEGIKQAIEGVSPPPDALLGWIVVISLCLIGMITFFLIIGVIIALSHYRKKS